MEAVIHAYLASSAIRAWRSLFRSSQIFVAFQADSVITSVTYLYTILAPLAKHTIITILILLALRTVMALRPCLRHGKCRY